MCVHGPRAGVAADAQDLGGVRPVDAVGGGGADGPPLAAAVPFALFGPGGVREAGVGAGQGFRDGLQQGRLVALDDHQVVRVLVLDQVAGGFGLGVQRVQGHNGAGQVQVRDGRGQFRDFVGLGADFPLGAHAPRGHVEHGQQMDLAAISADRAADRLAVRGGLLCQAGRARPGGRRGGAALLALVPGHGGQGTRRAGGHRGKVPIQRRVERLGVDVREDPGEGADTGRADPPGPRVAPPAQDGQRVRRAAGRPLGNRGRRVVPGRGERADRERQHELQRMPPAQPRPRVRDAGQPLTQAAARFISGKNPGQFPGRDVDQGR